MAIVEKVDGFFIPNVTLIGVGAAKAIPERIVYLNATKPLLVTDKGIVHTGILKQITDILDEAAMEYAIYDETVPNPTDLNVAAGVELYKKEECDSLISIGGGSSHDCCKGIGLVVSNGGKIHDYEGVDKSTKAMPPYLAVNTTAGTASEITRFCIITDSARKVKMAIVDWRITPSVAINDPILMVGMPPALTAATGMDALTHAVEAYVSTGATPLTDACAEKAIKLVSENLRRAVANGSDIHAREGMCYAQYLAGMAFNNASLGHVHAMAHQLRHLIRGQHLGLSTELFLIFVVIHLGISRHHDDDGFLSYLEAHRLGDPGALHAYGHRRQFYCGGGNVEFPDAVLNAELLEILSYLLNRHSDFLFLD